MDKKLGKDNLMSFIKSNRGGVSNLIFEVLMTLIILSLMLTVIFVYRNNLEIISSAADRVNDTDKIKAQSLLPLDKNIVTGSDVISVLRYYQGEDSVEIEVRINQESKSYRGEGYDPETFPIHYLDLYESTYEYHGSEIKNIRYNKI